MQSGSLATLKLGRAVHLLTFNWENIYNHFYFPGTEDFCYIIDDD